MSRFYAAAIAILILTTEARGGALHDAVKAGDLPGAKAAIAQGADVNEKAGLQTPLVAAIRASNHDMAVLLLDNGADPNKGIGSNTPLSMACDKGDTAFVQVLLEKGADARFSTNDLTALHHAADSGCLKCAEMLLGAGADINALTSLGTPAIHLAKVAGHEDMVAFLLAQGYEPPRLAPIFQALKAADAARGKAVYEKNCGDCHRQTERPTAPSLGGIAGRARASITGFEYSDALRAVGGNWTDDDLNAFIAHPAAAVPGTAMPFGGLQEVGERADIISYLHTLVADP